MPLYRPVEEQTINQPRDLLPWKPVHHKAVLFQADSKLRHCGALKTGEGSADCWEGGLYLG